jgi:ketosteroid isomerase-like protein
VSQENVALAERIVRAMDARKLSDELAEELLAPGCRLENPTTAVTDKTYVGVGGVREWIRDMFEAFDEESHYEVEEVLADDDDFVVARLHLVGHGAHSGAPVSLRWVTVAWFQDGKMARAVGYLGRREALKAVGLAE